MRFAGAIDAISSPLVRWYGIHDSAVIACYDAQRDLESGAGYLKSRRQMICLLSALLMAEKALPYILIGHDEQSEPIQKH